jgi:hypothetical protein
MVTTKLEKPGPQIAALPLRTALVGDGFTVTAAVPLNTCEEHPFESITPVRI